MLNPTGPQRSTPDRGTPNHTISTFLRDSFRPRPTAPTPSSPHPCGPVRTDAPLTSPNPTPQQERTSMPTATRVNTPTIPPDEPADGNFDESSLGYRARITVEGTNSLLLDRYNADVIAAKAALPKGHSGKKAVNHEAQVYRHPDTGNIAVPGAAFLSAIEGAAKFLPPIPGRLERSPAPLITALVNLAPEDELVDIGIKSWDLIDGKRITLSRGADTMLRPAILAGWRASFSLDVVLGGLITPAILRSAIEIAGKAKGVGSYRRVHGRFMVIAFDYDWDAA